MEAQQSTYTYTPLDDTRREIRVLHIRPKSSSPSQTAKLTSGEDTDTIDCFFSRTTLEDPSDFEALSYVWGDASKKKPIRLQGHDFPVTENLHQALVHLRKDYDERICWIDALCINQGDLEERASQVSQMEYIYRLAKEVIVFLGPYWKGQEIALRFMFAIASDKDLHYSPLQEPHFTSNGGLDASSELLCSYLARFFALPWWTRAWTVQEGLLAQQVTFMSGIQEIPAPLIGDYLKNINPHFRCCLKGAKLHWRDEATQLTVWESQTSASALFFSAGAELEDDLLYRVTRFRFRGCWDVRDNIYSVLGLASPAYRERIKVSYTTPTAEVFQNMAIASIEVTESLDVLSHVCGPGHPLLSTRLPSCVPDWTSNVGIMQREPLIQRLKMLHYKPFKASRKSKAHITITNGTAITVAMGIDKVAKVADQSDQAATWPDTVPKLRKLGKIDGDVATPYASRDNAFWKTLGGGIHPGGLGNRKTEPFYRFEDKDEHMYREWFPWDPLNMTEGSEIFGHAVMSASACRRFILTEKGYIGWGPEDCKAGDEVVLMPGGRVPYIVRTFRSNFSDPNARLCKFLGDAYVHGVMGGEAWLDPEALHPIVFMPRKVGAEDEDSEDE
ncbi:hypothetical protein HBI83_040680 [Parastagonospora nodorum]|nr:hypothetical protein HBI83_040680 [Parastagonospora nodorum]